MQRHNLEGVDRLLCLGRILHVRLLLVQKLIKRQSLGVCSDQTHSRLFLLRLVIKLSLVGVLCLILLGIRWLVAEKFQVCLNHI